MKIYRAKDYEGMSRKAADIVAARVILDPNCVLGLATGSTPVGMYKQLVRRYNEGELDFSFVKTVNLDEYVGLAQTHEQSYRYFMQKNLFDHINIDPKNTHVPDGISDPEEECIRYNRVLNGFRDIDIQVLGLGHNGHIGFNEPGDCFQKDTHIVNLQQSTIDANSRFFASRNDIPKRAITMGIRQIMQAKTILMLVSGEGKADIIKEAFLGPVTPRVPASVLQLHPNVILVGDKAALSKL
ncbi:MAG: glucosamine-6-phosphate deaminase [Clostridiales bacterium]|nr:glucosamine-6-phosphate deaminase [Clostridiales bacterium]